MSAELFEGRVIITVANHKHDTPPSVAEALFRGEPRVFSTRKPLEGTANLP